MNKLAKGFLFAIGGVVALTCISVLGVNLYVESVGVQTRLEQALSDELHMPVKLEQLRYSLWGGLRVTGLTVAQPIREPSTARADYFLEAPQISARIAVGPLFSRRLVVRELVIDSPRVVWRQTSKGRWELPGKERPAIATAERSRTTARAREPRSQPKLQAEPQTERSTALQKPSPSEARQEKKKVEFRIGAARLQNARFDFLDEKDRPMAVFEGVTLNCPQATLHAASGTVVIRRVTLHDRVVVQNVIAPFEYSKGKLVLPQLDALLAGGSVSGSYHVFPEADHAPFTLDLQFDRVDLNQLMEEIGSDETVQRSHGKLKGYLHLDGLTGRPRTLHGTGQIDLTEGRMEQYPLLQSIGVVLQIDELTRLELDRARLDFWVAKGRVHIHDLEINSANLRLTARGESRFDGKLSLDAGLTIHSRISRQLPGWVESNFEVIEGSDSKLIRFGISGTLENPETDLMRVMVGEKLEKQALDLFKAFRSLTGGSRRKPKQKEEQATRRKETASTPREEQELPPPIPAPPREEPASQPAGEPTAP